MPAPSRRWSVLPADIPSTHRRHIMSTSERTQDPVPQSVSDENNQLGPDIPPQRRSWAVLALALVAQVLVVLDISVVNTALPTIAGDLQLTSADLQWVVTAYLLISGGGLLLGG